MQLNHILSLLAAAAGINASPVSLQPRAVVSHDSLWPMAESLPTGAIGDAIRRFEPYLHIAHGCQVMTAVNENGDTSGGLQDSGNPSAGCRFTDRQQTYVRTAWHNGRFAIMYAWYWPKDQPNAGNVAGGHRHEWESTVVWLDNPENATPALIGAAASGHGGYKTSTDPSRKGDRVKVEYYTEFPRNHELQFSSTEGWGFWKIHWDNLPGPARQALQDTDFGSANVPFKDGNFESNLDKAWV
ncbi:hypothetical protein IFR04_012783 [Cadophora malorum]|uniref:Necrosis and ethylene inducing peptide 1 n=1 Tax=Cadophora malorum TaxID=108018 RepID=A0A8H7T6K6_9HELO|nr:hypothetical protein IFR04_012783 [Cadophora malorum]